MTNFHCFFLFHFERHYHFVPRRKIKKFQKANDISKWDQEAFSFFLVPYDTLYDEDETCLIFLNG